MQIIKIVGLTHYEVTVYNLKHGIVASFPMQNSLNPILLSIDGGRTWTVTAKNTKGFAAWQSDTELQGPVLDAAIYAMCKKCKFRNAAEIVKVAHILMVQSLKGFPT